MDEGHTEVAFRGSVRRRRQTRGADNEREDMEVVDKAQWNYSNSFV